jgi:hypothetical protein
MKTSVVFFFGFVVLTGCTGVSVAQEFKDSKVDPTVWQKVKRDGIATVIVSLNVPFQPEGNLSQDMVKSQRQAIAEAQNTLLRELSGTKYESFRSFFTIPGVGLKVSADALAVLEASSVVKHVTESKWTSPHDLNLYEIKP